MSWEDYADDKTSSQPPAQNPSLSVGAPSFVPNINAQEFVIGGAWGGGAAGGASLLPPSMGGAAPAPVAAPAAAPAPTPAPAPAAADPPAPAAEPPKKEEATPDPEPVKETAPEPTKPEATSAAAAATAEDDESVLDDDDDLEDDDEGDNIELTDAREHVNVVFIGHVDAGKSTIGGHLMFLTGGVDKRTLEKYEREAKEKNRESWYLSWALDTNEEERAKGKTVECGKAHFTTDKKHFTIIDAPGHKSFVPNMISGAVQADFGILVISARRGEFETGFERGGQTREHAMLAKTAGVKHLIIVINKMDDSTVNWDEERYKECQRKLTPFLKQTGFNPKSDVYFLPVSGLTGANLLEQAPEDVCAWYRGPSLVEYLDALPKVARMVDSPLRMPITDKYKDMGTIALGKLQAGRVKKGQKALLMPNRQKVVIEAIVADEEEKDVAISGDNVKLKIKCEEEDIMPGYVLCSIKKPCHVASIFDVQIVILDYKSIIASGFACVVHMHSAVEEVTIKGLICHIDRKTGKPDKVKGRPRFIKQGDVCIARLETLNSVCVETFKENPGMGRLTLRDEGKTIAIGKVLKVFDAATNEG